MPRVSVIVPARNAATTLPRTLEALAAQDLKEPFEVLVVDEPFVGLDQAGKAALLDLLDDAADSGATVVVATHQMEYVDRANRCLALRDGELTHDGPADQTVVSRLLS